MSTDLYGLRVLDVAPDELRVSFRVFVVYYDTGGKTHAPIPDDPSFFLHELWGAQRFEPVTTPHPLRMVSVKQILDEDWSAANAHRYVRRVDRVATRNHPVADDDWAHLHDFYYERAGGWSDEDLLVQADFDVWVTDPRWLETLTPGRSWATTSYPIITDQVLEADAPTVLDLREPALTLNPFPGGSGDAGTPSDVAFSDDGRYLAVTSQACELVVFRTDDWTEHVRIPDSELWGQDIQWVPGTHQLTKRLVEGGDEAPTRAYDVDTGTEVDVAPQPRMFRSRTGRYRADSGFGRHRADGGYGGFTGYGAWVDVLTSSGESRLLHLPRGKKYVGSVSFSADERRMFVGQGKDVHVLDPEDGRLLATVSGLRPGAIVRPDGAYLAAVGRSSSFPDNPEDKLIDLWRVSDGALLMSCRSGGGYVTPTWSPDGSTLATSVVTGSQGYGGEIRVYRAGPPVEPPEEVHLTADKLRALIKSGDIKDEPYLHYMLIEREQDPVVRGRSRGKAGVRRKRRDGLWEAAEAYRKAVEIGGTTDAALHASRELASLLLELNDPEGAVAAARTAHSIAASRDLDDRKNSKALAEIAVRLGDALRTRDAEEDDQEQARAAYQQAIDLGAKRVGQATLGLGWTAYNLGEDDVAEAHLQRAVGMLANEPGAEATAAMLLGGIAKRRRDLPSALTWYQRGAKADSIQQPLAAAHLGELHYWLGDHEGTRTWYQRALKFAYDPAVIAEATFRLGELAAEDGDREAAAEFLRQAAATGHEGFAERAEELLSRLTGGADGGRG
ncbi:hypothetical protein GCM10022225_43270 [Plantactinospora mayteni]|uniref:Tetratricopeptide repeat protein n=1 Tax=Plantactinospora mayteni TaxID=566021 RepID=A0ABQ4ES18_9ACTN|nr:WD40 repeat domain-containing protein [Plantactinospora mayteni]GIG97463.1 hypothetical protein Pma05_40360 [Plantactinospora mayteni]